jgi:hypothetical protein
MNGKWNGGKVSSICSYGGVGGMIYLGRRSRGLEVRFLNSLLVTKVGRVFDSSWFELVRDSDNAWLTGEGVCLIEFLDGGYVISFLTLFYGIMYD